MLKLTFWKKVFLYFFMAHLKSTEVEIDKLLKYIPFSNSFFYISNKMENPVKPKLKCEKGWISIDYHIIRCVVQGWIEIQNWIERNRTKWSQLTILKIPQRHLFFEIGFSLNQFHWNPTSSARSAPQFQISNMKIWENPSMQCSKQRKWEKILQYLAAHYSNLKFISSIQCLLAHKQPSLPNA